MKSRLFPTLPASLELPSEELQSLLDEHLDIVRRIAANDAELIPSDKFSGSEVLEELTAGNEQIAILRGELAGRVEAEAAYETEVARLAAEAGVELTDDTDDAEGAADDAATDDADADALADAGEEAETDAAVEETADEPAAVVASVVRRPIPRPVVEREAQAVADDSFRGAPLTASAGLSGVRAGEILDRLTLAKAMQDVQRRTVAKAGEKTEVVVASARWEPSEDRILHDGDPEGNIAKIRAVAGPEALVASGGLCAPLTPIYDLPQISTEARPVRDSLPPFLATRGGITWAIPPSIADVSTAVGIITAAEDAEGGTFATKSCQMLDCEDFLSAEVAAIYHCLLWGNLGSRAWPERVAQFTDVVMAAFARLAEINILNLFKAGSTQVTAAAATYGYGALSSFTSEVLAAAAGYRSRFRMDDAARFRIVAPAWVRDLILSDLINSQFDRYAIQNYAGVDAFLSDRLIDPVWTLDGETSGNQIFGAQTASTLLPFPDSVKWFLYPEGTWIFLDSGVLELGIVRDSVLNATNDFEVFGESFETVAQVGYQSLEITSALCPSGSTGGPATLITCS